MNGQSDKQRFSVLMFWLAKRMLAPGGQPRDIGEILDDYFLALADIRIERLEWAATHLFATERWFPMPVELRTAAMLAPSSVFPALPCNRPLVCEFTAEQVAAAKAQFEAMTLDIAQEFAL